MSIFRSIEIRLSMGFAALVITAASIGFSYAQSGDADVLERLRAEAVENIERGDFVAATRLTLDALALAKKIHGEVSVQTADVHIALGFVYRGRQEYSASIQHLQTAVSILRKPGLPPSGLYRALSSLAFSQHLDRKNKAAEESYLETLRVAEQTFAKGSDEVFTSTLNLANFYSRTRDFDKAHEQYIRALEIAVAGFGAGSEQRLLVKAWRLCLVRGNDLSAGRRNREFQDVEGRFPRPPGAKAVLIPRPKYSPGVINTPESRTAPVLVKVEPDGSVSSARVVCGDPAMREDVQKAALLARFEPRAQPVFNLIVYDRNMGK